MHYAASSRDVELARVGDRPLVLIHPGAVSLRASIYSLDTVAWGTGVVSLEHTIDEALSPSSWFGRSTPVTFNTDILSPEPGTAPYAVRGIYASRLRITTANAAKLIAWLLYADDSPNI